MDVSGFWSKVERTESCWLWKGRLAKNGYARYHFGDGRTVMAHRVAYDLVRGPIPEGMTLDHLCRVRHCVNPAHLEPVAMKVNILRGDGVAARLARRRECTKGHGPFSWSETEQRRICKECRNDNERKRRLRVAEENSANPNRSSAVSLAMRMWAKVNMRVCPDCGRKYIRPSRETRRTESLHFSTRTMPDVCWRYEKGCLAAVKGEK